MPKTRVDFILQRIAELQCNKGGIFPIGTFPSYRSNTNWAYKRADSNIFATASTLFILKNIQPVLNESQSRLIEKMCKNAADSFELYRNKGGGETYNFWQTKPSKHFPNGYFLQFFKHFKLPDDIDDTALMYLLQNRGKVDVIALRNKVENHSQVFVKDQEYAYNTWFGEKMPLENDVCALCNLLYLILDKGLELNEKDHSTIEFIAESIKSEKYISQPFQIARHYASSPIIVYHYARLMGKFKLLALENQKVGLLAQMRRLFDQEKNMMLKLLLHSALLKLGDKVNFDAPFNELMESEFYPFIGAPFAPYSNKVLKMISGQSCLIINWECKALKLSYILENQVLRLI